MFERNIDRNRLTLTEKVFSLDYIMILTVLIIGVISCFAMYVTDRGNFGYHTTSHIIRFSFFFLFFIFIGFIRVNFWHKYAYFIYLFFLILLFQVEFFGLTASGSKRWINLYFINLQPSELMKIGIILFLAKYYHRVSAENINRFNYMFLPLLVTVIPIFLVINQPDLGTSVLIAATACGVIWLAGVRIKYFTYISSNNQ